MRLAIATAFFGLIASASLAQQTAPVEFLITPNVFEASADRATDLVSTGTLLRTKAGVPATVDLSDEKSGVRLVVVPTDLGSGRVALHVQVTTTRDGRSATSTFDVLAGA